LAEQVLNSGSAAVMAEPPGSDNQKGQASHKKHKKNGFRARLRRISEDPKVELATVSVVLFYLLIIVIDIVVPDLAFPCDENMQDSWSRTFWTIDMSFLALFLLELFIRFFAWGAQYFKDAFNTVDAIIIVGSFAVAIVVQPSVFSDSDDDGVQNTAQITRLVRVVRVFRLLTAMTKFQKNRAATDIKRKKRKFGKSGSYVERVIDILQRMRKTSPFFESAEDRENINFIMDIIVSDQLYAVNITGASESGAISNDMAGFLTQTGVASSATRKIKRKEEGDAGEGDENGVDAEAQRIKSGRNSAARRVSMGGDDEHAWVEKLLESEGVKERLQNAHKWDFNMFELEKASGQHPVIVMVLHMVRVLELDDHLPINMGNLIRYLCELEAGYKDPKEVPFHNFTHAADVTHGTTYFLLQPKVRVHFSHLDLYCLILAAAMHDFEHPGVSNAYLVNARHEYAILYNDSSVLESFHVSRSWRLMLTKGQDPFDGFPKEDCMEARATIVQCILGTDMKFHFDHLTKFKTRAQAGAFEAPDRKDVRLLLTMCLHAADVSNPAKPWHLSKEWTSRVMDEFFKQGDAEMEAGLPISPFMDRSKTNIATCQVGFINILIKPFFYEWCDFLGEECLRDVYANVESNVLVWQEQGEEVLGDRLALIKAPPSTT